MFSFSETVVVVVFSLVLLAQASKPSSFSCYECRSTSSWEDCINKQKLVKCPDVFPADACTTYHRVLTLMSGHQEHSYVKECWALSDCSSKACRQTVQQVKGSYCKMHCCNSTACNRQDIFKKSSPVMLSQVGGSTAASTGPPHGLLTLIALVLVVTSLQ